MSSTELIENLDKYELVTRGLETLTESEKKILMLRFGLGDNPPQTLETIGKSFGVIGAPPMYAAVPPRKTKVTSAVPDVTSATQAEGASNAAPNGTIAHTEKDIADAIAAWIGRERIVSEMPSSFMTRGSSNGL